VITTFLAGKIVELWNEFYDLRLVYILGVFPHRDLNKEMGALNLAHNNFIEKEHTGQLPVCSSNYLRFFVS